MRANKCGQVQTDPYAGWVGRVPCGKLALPTEHPHTDPWEAGSSAETEWASLPVGTLLSEQMGQAAEHARPFRPHAYFPFVSFIYRKQILEQKAQAYKIRVRKDGLSALIKT